MADMAKKPAVLVCPGGAYLFTSAREGEPIALAYAARGFQAFVLWYSVGKDAVGCKPLLEASAAIALMRKNAEVWHLDANKIATVGFSAGGHLAAWVGLCGENKPNAMVLCYPAVELAPEVAGKNPLVGSLLGEDYAKEDAKQLNLPAQVKGDSVPMFVWGTVEDALIPVSSLVRLCAAYAEAKRPFETHLFQQGEHGMALANHVTANGRKSMVDAAAAAWVEMSVEWLYRNFGRPEITDKPHAIAESLKKKLGIDRIPER